MKRNIATGILFTAALLAAACGNDSGGNVMTPDGGVRSDSGVPAPDGGCAVEPTFTSIHDVVLSSDTCATSGCHGGSGPGNGLSFDRGKAATFAELLDEMTGDEDAVATVPKRVTPGDPAASFLYRKLADSDPPGDGSRMPSGCSDRRPQFCLPQCEVDALRTWIENGAQDN